jgi:hypothetical protein
MYVTMYVCDQERTLEFCKEALGLKKGVDYPDLERWLLQTAALTPQRGSGSVGHILFGDPCCGQ